MRALLIWPLNFTRGGHLTSAEEEGVVSGYELSVLGLQEANIQFSFQRPWISSHFIHTQWKQWLAYLTLCNFPYILWVPPCLYWGVLVMMG